MLAYVVRGVLELPELLEPLAVDELETEEEIVGATAKSPV